MLLYHSTDYGYISAILNDGKLKPSSKTKKQNENPYNKFLPYVFFNTFPHKMKYIKQFLAKSDSVGIIFDSSILKNHVFYTNKNHSAGISSKTKKYDKKTKNINNILYNLYKHSLQIIKKIKSEYWILSTFQEVFTKVEPKLKDCKYILLPNSKDENTTKQIEKTEKKIKKMYPHITIIKN